MSYLYDRMPVYTLNQELTMTSESQPSPAHFVRTLTRHTQIVYQIPAAHLPADLHQHLPPHTFVITQDLSADELEEELAHIRERLLEDRTVRVLCTTPLPLPGFPVQITDPAFDASAT